MNYIWGVMIMTGIVYGILTGNVQPVSEAVLDSSKEAVSLCITMLGMVSVWSGLMEIAQDSGLVGMISEKAQPVIRFLFPGIPKGHPSAKYITMNCVANMLGLGWAATPAGLKAMESLKELEEERRKEEKKNICAVSPETANDEMCTLLILNISSLQLIPVNMIAYRAQYGSVEPTAVIVPGIAATAVSTGAAVLFCLILRRMRGYRHPDCEK